MTGVMAKNSNPLECGLQLHSPKGLRCLESSAADKAALFPRMSLSIQSLIFFRAGLCLGAADPSTEEADLTVTQG